MVRYCLQPLTVERCDLNITLRFSAVSWRVGHDEQYCLYSSLQNNKLTCWLMKKSARFKQELVIDKDVTFTLKSMSDDIGNNIENGEVIFSAVLELARVHKKPTATMPL
jgi:hypothetical protein